MVIPLSYFQGGVKTVTNILYFDGDGFGMLYKRLDNGKLQWPKDENEVRNLSQQELHWLLEWLSIQLVKGDSTFIKRCVLNSLSY
ncbi:IS66 family insertion sequence element accessory protein TnpB [Neobacillus massiliamazoniensis]|uniref:IS66 family insertion sequence element accessory protein TnpB n=1 Tax=Neobacillus massiliamazoniensis TaxID=1499688 RepID=UPI000B81F6D7|nr:IS66 family insertion sequence element accessory protein TnpB [Neobacillus massiliamazoniensis]